MILGISGKNLSLYGFRRNSATAFHEVVKSKWTKCT